MPSKNFAEVQKLPTVMQGELIIKSIDTQGNVFTYKTPNVIVFDARETMAHLLAGDGSASLMLANLAVGDNGTAPARSDTALLGPVTQVAFTSHTYPAAGQVEFTALLDFVSPANGHTLAEAGLISFDGTTLFSRQVYGAITKTVSIQLQYIWRIIFT